MVEIGIMPTNTWPMRFSKMVTQMQPGEYGVFDDQ